MRSCKQSFVDGFDGAPYAHEIPPEILKYIEYVESGKKAFCVEQIKLATYVRKCFAEQDIYVHTEQLRKYLGMQKYFPYRLFPWEVFCLALHCCTYWVKDNTPRWEDLFIMVGRGSGKNGYLAFEDFCELSPYNGIHKYNIDICANNEDQARTSFDDIYDVLEANRDTLCRFYKWNKEAITCIQTGSVLKFRTNNPSGKDGLRSGKVDFDEVHEYANYSNIDVFTTGFGKKPHPRRTFITTNGFVRDGVLDDYVKTSGEILDGVVEDDLGWLPFVCRLESEAEIDTPELWHKANPSLEYLPNLQREIRKEYGNYRQGKSTLSFVVKRMNLVKSDREVAVTDWSNILATNRPIPNLTGRKAVVGIDYASISDFAAAGFLIRDGDMRYWIMHAWMCRQSKDIDRIKAPWREWERMGLLTVVDDVEIAPELITQWIEQTALHYNVRRIALDFFRLGLMRNALKKIGFDSAGQSGKRIYLCRKTGEMKVAPVIESMFANHQIIWGDNPLMRWAANNTKVERDAKTGNMTYGKIEPKSRKNDPFMALVAAMQVEDELDCAAPVNPIDINILTF